MKGKRRLPEQKAIQIMRDASLEPLVPYVSTSTKWKSRCMKCQSVVYPRLHSLQRGKGGCRFCAAKKRHEHFKFPDSHAYQLAQKAKVVPLEPYVNMNTKWKCRCLICDKIVTPRLSDMKKGMGCKRCANLIANARLKLSDEKALAVMQKAKLQPLTPYENANKSWKCQCLVCGNLVSPSLNSIRDGGGCKYCATGGIKLQEPTYLYLITHIEFNSHKVGISNVKSEKKGSIDRLFRFNKLGWHTYKTWNFNSGNDALKVEKAIFKIIRDNLKIPIHLAKEQMPITLGHTETMDADLISLVELEKIINKVIKGHGK
jgi:hypothetical protein